MIYRMNTMIALAATVILVGGIFVDPSMAQMARKPSPTREPAGAMPQVPDSKKNSLSKVTSQAEFDSIARTYHQNTPSRVKTSGTMTWVTGG